MHIMYDLCVLELMQQFREEFLIILATKQTCCELLSDFRKYYVSG